MNGIAFWRAITIVLWNIEGFLMDCLLPLERLAEWTEGRWTEAHYTIHPEEREVAG